MLRTGTRTAARTLCVLAALLAGLGLAAGAGGAEAVEIRFPLTVDYDPIRIALGKHLHEQAGGELELWRTANGCGQMTMRDVSLDPADGRLKISGRASARSGLFLLGLCWASVAWDGHVEVTGQPEIGPDWQLRLTDLEVRLDDANGKPSGLANTVWAVIRGWAESEISRFAFDLGPSAGEVRSLLATFAGTTRTAPLLTALGTFRPAGVVVEPEAAKVFVAIDLPPPTAPLPKGPEPALTPAQIKRFETVLERWDGFLAFVVKDFGAAATDPAVRGDLLDLLISARHDLVAVLARGPESGSDPVRELFFSVWTRLRTVARQVPVPKGDEGRALRLLVFVSAGDALSAIEAAAPAAGVEISADGLRRLARSLDPAYSGDPLQYSEQPDQHLQQIFRFRDPDAPPRRPRRPPTITPSPGSWRWLAPRQAHADETADEWFSLARRLDRWAPAAADRLEYRDTVDRLLTVAAERTIDPDALAERYDDLFHTLIKAVAWQESCWLQFVRKGGNVTYVLSRTGDVGMMQINARIWRGFFNPDKLRWSTAYNVGAGAEILQSLLIRYGTRESSERFENAARATYSAYNGGPARYRRYRLPNVPVFARAVDRQFWEKYQAMASGQADVASACLPSRS